MDALTLSSLGDGQYCREGSFYFGRPGILVISHNPIFSKQPRYNGCLSKYMMLRAGRSWQISPYTENNISPVGKKQCDAREPGDRAFCAGQADSHAAGKNDASGRRGKKQGQNRIEQGIVQPGLPDVAV